MLSISGITYDNKLKKDLCMPIKRAYSVSSIRNEKYIEFCVKKENEGTVSLALSKLKIGDTINITGPYGKFVLKENKKDIVLLAIGSGITPIMSMLRSIVKNKIYLNKKITLIYGNKEEITYKDEIIKLCKDKINLIFSLTKINKKVTNCQTIFNRITISTLEDLNIDYTNSNIYMCGKLEFIKNLKDSFKEKGISKENINFEIY